MLCVLLLFGGGKKIQNVHGSKWWCHLSEWREMVKSSSLNSIVMLHGVLWTMSVVTELCRVSVPNSSSRMRSISLYGGPYHLQSFVKEVFLGNEVIFKRMIDIKHYTWRKGFSEFMTQESFHWSKVSQTELCATERVRNIILNLHLDFKSSVY